MTSTTQPTNDVVFVRGVNCDMLYDTSLSDHDTFGIVKGETTSNKPFLLLSHVPNIIRFFREKIEERKSYRKEIKEYESERNDRRKGGTSIVSPRVLRIGRFVDAINILEDAFPAIATDQTSYYTENPISIEIIQEAFGELYDFEDVDGSMLLSKFDAECKKRTGHSMDELKSVSSTGITQLIDWAVSECFQDKLERERFEAVEAEQFFESENQMG